MLNEYIDKLNVIQRVGIFLWGLFVIASLALHNPISGYYSFTYKIGLAGAIQHIWEISEGSYASSFRTSEARKLVEECHLLGVNVTDQKIELSLAKAENKRLGCNDTHFYPISNWESIRPVLPWFGSVINVIWGIFWASISTLFFLFIFKKKK